MIGLLTCTLAHPALALQQTPDSTGPAGASDQTTPTAGQSAPPAPAPTRDKAAGTEIVVTGQRPTIETSIDRKSYSLSKDIQATTGSAADVLRNIPSVTVDPNGNPSLRGDANVQILVDGRPSPQFNNANRGAALEQLGADNIDHIEVLTNPPANFKPDGSAGVINIVTKRRRGSRTASVQANAGSGGRFNLGGTASTQIGKLNVHGSLSLRHDIRTRILADDKTVSDPVTGAFQADSRLRTDAQNDRLSEVVTLGADLDLSKADRLSAEGTYNNRFDHSSYVERDLVLDSSGAPTSRYSRDRPGRERQISNSAMLQYHHDVDKDGNGLTVLAQRSETSERQRLRYTNSFDLPALDPTFQNQNLYFDQVTREFSIDYTTMLPGKSKLITGYDLQRDDNLFDNAQTLAVPAGGAAVPDPRFTNIFRYGQTVQAFYGSYERPIGDWTVLAGLRLEQTDVQTNQVTSGERGSRGYFRAYPNLHLTDKLTDHQTLSFSYGRRVIRPESDDLNPYIVQQDAFTLRRGNPGLMPQEIESFEAGWSYEKGSTSRSATLYFRRVRNAFTIVSTPIDSTTVLITEENLGKSRSGGLELAAAGKLVPKLGYTLSGNVFYNEISAGNLGFTGTRSTFGYEAKAALNWSLTPKDTAQLNLGGAGKRLTPQGYRRGYVALDLGFRHQLRTNLSLTATLSDVFASRHDGLLVDTPGLSEITSRRQTGRIALLGISWTLPGAKAKESDKFDYEK